jgi:hypothetical protein
MVSKALHPLKAEDPTTFVLLGSVSPPIPVQFSKAELPIEVMREFSKFTVLSDLHP